AHAAFEASPKIGIWVVAVTLIASAASGRALVFLNLSSLQQSLAQKLVRTFLGASNDARVHPSGTTRPVAVHIADDGDAAPVRDHALKKDNAPPQLLKVYINETVDDLSRRQPRDNNCVSMGQGPGGISVGRSYHALWGPRANGQLG